MKYEEVLKERERNNPKYAFLIHRNVGCPFLFTLSVVDCFVASATCILSWFDGVRPCFKTGI